MSYNRLYFWTVHFDLENKVSPSFICPRCGHQWDHNYRFKKAARIKALNFNRKVNFRCPRCGLVISLYVAIHKDERHSPSICVSVNPIPNDWWISERT